MALRKRSEQQERGDAEGAPSGSARDAAGSREWGARTVRVTWGEEKITPVPGSYSTVTVGPLDVTFALREGEDLGERTRAALAELAEIAEVERERKIANFVNKLRQVVGRARGDG